MADYIRREDAIEAIRRSPITNMGTKLFCYDEIGDIPAANVVEQKTGQWIKTDDEYGETWMCSECCEEWVVDDMDEFVHYAHYCPNCGARMVTDDV